jgi:hypothetical protein
MDCSEGELKQHVEDFALVASIQCGLKKAECVLYEKYSNLVYYFALNKLRNM